MYRTNVDKLRIHHKSSRSPKKLLLSLPRSWIRCNKDPFPFPSPCSVSIKTLIIGTRVVRVRLFNTRSKYGMCWPSYIVLLPFADSSISPFKIASRCASMISGKFCNTFRISSRPLRATLLFPGLRTTFWISASPKTRSRLCRLSVTLPCSYELRIRILGDTHTKANVTTEWFGRTASPRRFVPSSSAGSRSRAESMLNPLSWSSPAKCESLD